MKRARNSVGVALGNCFAIGLAVGVVATPIATYADAGSYLAARQAMMQNDLKAQSTYSAISLMSDPGNLDLLEAAVASRISTGQIDDALGFATMLQNTDPQNQLAAMVLLTKLIEDGAWDAVLSALDEGKGISSLVDRLLRAWVFVGKGDMSEALGQFDDMVGNAEGFDYLVPYNRALALALVGDFEGALETLSGPGEVQTGSAIIVRVQMLSQLERTQEALDLLTEAFGPSRDPLVLSIKDTLSRGETVPFDLVSSAQDGIAGVFNAVSQALDGGVEDSYTLLYARLAQKLKPDNANYTLSVADLLERMGNHELATEVYDQISQEDPLYLNSVLGRADALRASGKKDAEIEVLHQLTKTFPAAPEAWIALGDAVRRDKRYEDSAQAYTKALELTPTLTRVQWPLLFTRGIAYERMGEWDKAEADFRKALELEPGQARVLNYMGYSFIEMKTNLEEAMSMIRAAVAARPNDGFITDSLAWGLFRLGKYEQAVEPMERAVELEPVDPILNDHLGDIYWAVGRDREARFQWERALSFEPEPEEAERIRRKLLLGLDRVLVEEGEEPIRSLVDG